MKQQQTTELAKKNIQTSLDLPKELEGSWGAEESSSEDIIVPKILLMHGQSKLVLKGEQQVGTLIKSTDQAILAKKGEAVRVIPFSMVKTWRNSEIVNGQAEWRGEEPWTPANTDMPWEYEEKDAKTGAMKKMRRDKAYNFYCILAADAKKGFAMPVRLQFARTSRKAGNLVADYFSQCKAQGKPPATLAWDIGSEFIEGDKQKYFVFTAKQAANTTLEEMTVCKQWWEIITKQKARIKDHDIDDSETTATAESEDRF